MIGLFLTGLLAAAPGAVGAREQVAAPGLARRALPPAASGSAASDTGGAWVRREALLMGTRLRLRLRASDREAGHRAAEAALVAVRGVEDLLSTWRPDTELSRLNRAQVGRAVSLGAPGSPLRTILRRAHAWSRRTGGAFEPGVGALVDAWRLRSEGRVPPEPTIREALEATGSRGLGLDFEAGTLERLHASAWIDAGGFGKGAALEAASRSLEEAGIRDAYLDFGGQILVRGGGPNRGAGWPVSVAHPERRLEPAAALVLDDATAATSGASERHVVVDGRRLSHVIDPRSGRPAPDRGSVTVVARDPLAADAASTALFVMGPEAGMAWARERDELGVLFLVPDGEGGVERRWNRAMEPWLAEPGAGSPESSTDDRDQPRE